MSWLFFREYVRNWQNTGAVAPSSSHLARQIVQSAGVASARNVLELGPGTGAFTKEIQKTLSPGADYLGLEMNAAFVTTLREQFPQMRFEQSAAQEFDYAPFLPSGGFDAIVSGLPWAALPPPVQSTLLDTIFKVLKPGGTFATFVYSGIHWSPRGQSFRRLLVQHCASVKTSATVWRNLPPAFIYVAKRNS
jgi:phosphatidylethanolamine/phosphatidyl-N-methylethanolamine N-methyltransferase